MKYTTTQKIAQTIFEGFEHYFDAFTKITQSANSDFKQGNYRAIRDIPAQRHKLYNQALLSVLDNILKIYPALETTQEDWAYLKQEYSIMLQSHPAGEIAETFFNSSYCRLYDYQNLDNQYLFINKSYYKRRTSQNNNSDICVTYEVKGKLFETIYQLTSAFGFAYENLDRDVGLITASLQQRVSPRFLQSEATSIEVVKSVFYRNKGGYIIGKLHMQGILMPFVLPILNAQGKVIIDTLITNPNTLSIVFSFAHPCFVVDTPAPSILVDFLQSLLPDKLPAELYSSIGFSNHSKTTLNRQFQTHIKKAPDEMMLWQNQNNTSITTFTLPSFNMVFRVLHDEDTLANKQSTTKNKYRTLAFYHRAGRMTEALEFHNFIFPREIMSQQVLEHLQNHSSSQVNVLPNQDVLIEHLLIERRMVSLDIFLKKANTMARKLVMNDYGNAIKQLALANILPGNLSLNSFGVSQHNRVICYDYEHLVWLTDIQPDNISQITQQMENMLTNNPELKEALAEEHQDLWDKAYWENVQKKVKLGEIADVYPYEKGLRFDNKTDMYSF
jgi:isocitrate dehydrogenase kinase/phosphatase